MDIPSTSPRDPKDRPNSVGHLKKRANKVWQDRANYDATLRDVYDYVMPMRAVTGLHVTQGRTAGDTRVDKVFDATAVKACYRFAGRLQTELTPIFSPFFALEAGPLLAASVGDDTDEIKSLNEQLAMVTAIAHGVINASTFNAQSQEMYADLYAGTGCMLMEDGDSDDEPLRFHVAPIAEIGLEEGPWGEVWGIYWRRSRKARDLPAMWKNAKWSQQLAETIKSHPDADVVIHQYTQYDAEAKNWRLICWSDKCADDAEPFHQKVYRTKPWLTPRFFKIPGESYGRGPAQMAMPFIKTTNKARELALKAAAFALMGLWTRKNDGVFNPDTANFSPATMWQVASTGGPTGPTIARLDVPKDFDVSSIVMADEREQMKLALFDDTLPPETAAVRSATEIAERMRRQSQDFLGVFGRFTLEIVVPLVRRIVDVLETRGMLGGVTLKIDQLLTQVRVVAPIASGQQASKVQSAVDWVQTMTMLAGPEAAMLAARMETLGPQLGRWFGVDEAYIRSDVERQQMMQAAQAQAQQQAQAEAAAANPVAPHDQIMNGGVQ